MALALYDRVQQTGTANTTVSFTLSGTVTGFQSFSVIGNGNTTYYAATDSSGNWEVGLGTYSTTGPTLTRTTVYQSSNSGSAVTFSGTVNVFVTYPASNSVVASNNAGTSGYALTSGGSGVAPTWSILSAPAGGTGQSSYAVGDLLYASTTTALSKLADVATGNALISGGVGVAPSYGKIGLTTHVSGTLAVGNGGTGATTLTGLVVGNGASAMTTVTAPTGTVVGTTDTQTLTNKTIVPRVSSTTSITSPLAWNSDNFDMYVATAQAGALTINADSGTGLDGEKIQFRFTCDATPRVITFTGGVSKGFKPVGVTLTASASNWTYTLTASKTTYFGAIYNTTSARWEIVALSQEA